MDVNKESFERSAKVYDRDNLTHQEKTIISKYFKGKVLDVGCGAGRTTVNLKKMGFDVIGINYAQNLIKLAKEKYPKIDFKVMNATQLKFKDNSFDTVFFSYNGIDYLNPFSKRMRFIKEAKRVLKKDGVLVYSSHKRFYFELTIQIRYPFVKIHYLSNMMKSIFAFNNYRNEKHDFGMLNTYCKSNSSDEALKEGFSKVKRINGGHSNYYICYK